MDWSLYDIGLRHERVMRAKKFLLVSSTNNKPLLISKFCFHGNIIKMTLNLTILEKVATKWVPCSRNDEIPHNAVYAGTTSTDGKVYVARINNTPGKVNLRDGTNKIWNFWVHGLWQSSLSGEILTTNGTCSWIDIKHGELIPNNAVFSGRDHSNDKVWVARDKRGEPGKLNCHDNDSKSPKMYNLWCHDSCKNREGQILTIS